eukprot:1581947-Karenia_brevis.AAC.1
MLTGSRSQYNKWWIMKSGSMPKSKVVNVISQQGLGYTLKLENQSMTTFPTSWRRLFITLWVKIQITSLSFTMRSSFGRWIKTGGNGLSTESSGDRQTDTMHHPIIFSMNAIS